MNAFERFTIRAVGLAIDVVFGILEGAYRIRDAAYRVRGKPCK